MQVLNIFHVFIAIAMVALVLVQRGAGATAGAAFGSGASGTVFGSRGAGTFLTKSTWVLATLFCAISLTMAVIVSRSFDEPGTDLGVVGSAVPAEQSGESVMTQSVISAEENQQDDLPVLPTDDSDLPEQSMLQDSAEDLPVLDDVTTESVEDEGDAAGTAPDSDDS